MDENLFQAYSRSAWTPRAGHHLGVSLLALTMALAASEAHATCAQDTGSPSAITCAGSTALGSGQYVGPTANGTPITTVTIDGGASLDSQSSAIALGDNATVTIGAGATVHSHSQTTGPTGIGANTIEVGDNATITIAGSVTTDGNGTANNGQGDEVINPRGNGTAITVLQGGAITSLNTSVPTIWFQNLAGSVTTANTVTNYGTIQAGPTGAGAVIGNAGDVVVNFENGAGGVVNGNLSLGGGADSVVLRGGSRFNGAIDMGGGDDTVRLYKGATITGTIDGGGGTNALVLAGDATDPGNASVIPGSVNNFATLTKEGTSTWTLSGSLSQLGSAAATIRVDQGVLVLTGDNDGFQGTTTIASGGTVQIGAGGTQGTLPGAIANSGILALDRSDAVSVPGAITGTGLVRQIGTGTATLAGPLSGVSLRVDAGTLVLPAGQSLSTNGMPAVQGGVPTAAYLTGGALANAGAITSAQANEDAVRTEPGATLTNCGSLTGTASGVFAPVGGTIANSGAISGFDGIVFGNGAATGGLVVTGNGTVTGTGGNGITAVNAASDVTLGTAATPLGTVTGQVAGITVQAGNAGSLGIVAQGPVTGLTGAGIEAAIRGAGNSGTVSIAVSGAVLAGTTGIRAATAGTGAVTVAAGAITTTNGSGLVASAPSGPVSLTANGAISAGGAGHAGIDLGGGGADNLVTISANRTVQGAIGLRLTGGGTTRLSNAGTISAANAGGNAVQVDSGTLVIGATAGTLTGALATGSPGAIIIDRTARLDLANAITGSGTLNQNGNSLLNLTGANGAAGQFTGTANVNAGILAVNGTFGDTAGNAATVNVNTGGTLHGSGTLAGSVTVASGGLVSAGNSPGTLAVLGDYSLRSGATSLFELGTPGVVGGASNDLINVGGNLTLGGTLSLVNAADAAASPVAGTYRLFNYGGALAGTFGAVTSPTAQSYTVFTTIPGQVNLLVANGGQALQYWDGTDTTGAGAGGQGGTATWSSTRTNWTGGPTSTINTGWQSGVGIFGGTGGTVTVAGVQSVQGLQFTVDGYRLVGGSLNLAGDPFSTPGQSFINVDGGVGTTVAAGLVSTGGAIGLNKIGAGTLTLTGTNTYAGATSVTAGTLVLGAGGSLASTVAVAAGAAFQNAGTVTAGLANAGSTTVSGAITGPVSNGGTLTTSGLLAGGLTNTGTATATGGRLDGAVLNQGGSLTLAGDVTGDGTLSNAPGATVTVTDAGRYRLAGPFGNAGRFVSTGTFQGALANAGTAQVAGVLAGPVANTGILQFTGTTTGLTALTNDGLADLGGTSLAPGALAGSNPAAILRNGRLTVGSDDTATTYAGGIADGGGTTTLTKVGTGTLTLSGTSTHTGATTVGAGTLNLTGTLASAVSVGDGALLTGTGTAGGLVVRSGAAVAPGLVGTLGTLSVAGNVLFAPGSLYRIDADAAGRSDRIASSGVATLQGGFVEVTAGDGRYAPATRYTILTATGGVTGRFAGVTANFAFLTPSLTYDANDAYLTLTRNDLDFASVALTRNQIAAAHAAQGTGLQGRLYNAVSALSAPQARRAFDMISGEIHASAVTARYETAYLVREAILDRLRFGDVGGPGAQGVGQRFAPGTTLPAAFSADLPGRAPVPGTVPARLVEPEGFALWGQGFGAFGSAGGDGNAARLAQQTSGFVLGADTRLGSTWRVGVAGGYTYTALDVMGRLSSGGVESGFGGAYAGANFGAMQVRLGGTYFGSTLTIRRSATFAGFGETETSRYGGDLGQAFGEVGYRIGSARGYIEPFVGGAAIRITRDAFAERGGAAALTAGARDSDIATATVGAQVQAHLDTLLDTGTPLLIRGLVGYRRAYGDVNPSALFTFGAGAQPFPVAGVPIARNALVAQGGLDWRVAPSTTLSVAYTGQLGNQRTQEHGVKGSFLYRW